MPRGEKPRYIEPAPPYPKKTKCAMRRNNNGSVYKICYKSDTGNPPPKTKSAPKKAEEKKPAPKKPEPKKAEPKKAEPKKAEKKEELEEKEEKKEGGKTLGRKFKSLEKAKKFKSEKDGKLIRLINADKELKGEQNADVKAFLKILVKKQRAKGKPYRKGSQELIGDMNASSDELFPVKPVPAGKRPNFPKEKFPTYKAVNKLLDDNEEYKVVYKT